MIDFVKSFETNDFSCIVDQDEAVAWCTKQIETQQYSHVLFSGPAGLGKTITARRYAAGILCASDGTRPCGLCATCAAVAQGHFQDAYEEIDCPNIRDIGQYKAIFEKINRPTVWRTRAVLFLDEAHRITKAASNLLLKPLEMSERHTTVILSTSEPKEIPVTIRNRRVPEIAFYPFTFESALKALCQFLTKQGIAYDVDAAAALVAGADGSMARLLLDAQETFRKRGSITSNNLGSKPGGRDCDYAASVALAALTRGYAGAVAAIDGWRTSPGKKCDLIQRTFSHLFKTEIYHLVSNDRLFSSLDASVAQGILHAVNQHAIANSRPDKVIWRDAIKFWDPEPATTSASFEAKLERFCALYET